ncbi:MAG TPA: oxidoreductase [Solirubrobacteraceae bacterium]|nr:oxidoreductase [Solirubrobacteraceae bacterium]
MSGWTAEQIPDQSGRCVVVTGANSGLGLVTARELGRAGATVIMACRNQEKGRRALAEVQAVARGEAPVLETLDLSDLGSVGSFAERIGDGRDHLDLLINNAGVMAPPRRLTADGFESQFGTNHLGHFALTGRLLGLLEAAPAPRVVTLSSLMHRVGTLKFSDLQREHGYNNWLAYGQSKLANLMFALELQRRAVAAGSALLSLAAHPGYAATNLQTTGPSRFYEKWFGVIGNRLFAQSAERGALPTLFAATMDLPGGSFVGPDGLGESRGHPHVTTGNKRAYDEAAAARLWDVSEQLTGVHFAFGAPAAV